MFHKLKCLNTF